MPHAILSQKDYFRKKITFIIAVTGVYAAKEGQGKFLVPAIKSPTPILTERIQMKRNNTPPSACMFIASFAASTLDGAAQQDWVSYKGATAFLDVTGGTTPDVDFNDDGVIELQPFGSGSRETIADACNR